MDLTLFGGRATVKPVTPRYLHRTNGLGNWAGEDPMAPGGRALPRGTVAAETASPYTWETNQELPCAR